MKEMQELLAAEERYHAAAKALVEATKRAFPIGREVSVMLGGHEVNGPVTGVNDSWYCRPGLVQMRNEKTGKDRSFYGPKFAATADEDGTTAW